MKRFIIGLVWFMVPLLLMIVLALILPITPRASKSLLMADLRKDSILLNAPSPRLIFVGGSNLSFGLDSKTIRDSLGINPVNTAIHAAIGLKFMMDNALQFVKEDDIVVLVPEYDHFYKDVNNGSDELLRMILDVNASKISLLDAGQLLSLVSYVPKYAFSKYKINEYVMVKESAVYSVNSFNEFGDAFAHWRMSRLDFPPFNEINASFNFEVIDEIEEFRSGIEEKGASLYLSYPALHTTSFDNLSPQIYEVEEELMEIGIAILGTPEQYRMPDSVMFNTPYHLSKNGVDYRTHLFIEEFRKVKEHSPRL